MRVFADTQYFIALLSRSDASHQRAAAWKPGPGMREMVTTSAVLLELANFLHAPGERTKAAELIARLQASPKVRIVSISDELFARGFDLYRSRGDKEWSLTDCLSFVVMADERITEALTADHHFEQAGFVALLK